MWLTHPEWDRRGWVHGFTQRSGGVSSSPYESLNLGVNTCDDPRKVRENRRLLEVRIPGRWHRARQVHGNRVAVVVEGVEGDDRVEADALVSDRPDVVLAVGVADCLPILIVCPDVGAVGAIHAGWRGSVAGVLPETIRVLCDRYQAAPEAMQLLMGPSIRPCHYEVDAPVIEAVTGLGLDTPDVLQGEGLRRRLDLMMFNRLLAERVGVESAHIARLDLCTVCEQHRLFSYRAQGPETGRMNAFIGSKGICR
ncbi:MAG: peptidoglycan editing factor PgeF [Alphaproteobacteria bacterium CG_4_10_14_0_2_um_filter_63_37]|nr:MAG: hypothetical protein AUJ55_00855 [Proteobacteria bacterium CG1_02_64_396]PJA24585.1 MAG: peptidoglycan editing factor PgeF [Alphaproteobacteria bacterium CG_4_10_14_0_2_um_filter_63_37]